MSDAELTAERLWPPRLMRTQDIEWGVTPFDNLDREDLIRLLAAYHAAAEGADSVLSMIKELSDRQPGGAGPFWSIEGVGGRVLAKLDWLMSLVRGTDQRNERIYRSFFRSATAVMFPAEIDPRGQWVICDKCKVMISPGPGGDGCYGSMKDDAPTCPKVMRPAAWKDVRVERGAP